MKTLLLVLLCSIPSWAGKRIVMNMTVDGVSQRLETLVEPTRLRMNMGDLASIIFLTDGGRSRIVTLTPATNQYMEIDQAIFIELQTSLDGLFAKLPPEMRDQLKEQMRKETTSVAQPQVPKMVLSGERTVKGFPCKVYAVMNGDLKTQEVCVASAADLGISSADAAVFGLMRTFSEELLRSLSQLPFPMQLDGFEQYLNPLSGTRDGQGVQVIHYENGKATAEDLIQSVDDATFTDADFSTGTAVKREMPRFPQ